MTYIFRNKIAKDQIMANASNPVVIDNGSGTSKVGFANDKAPKIVFPTKVGRPRHQFKNIPELKDISQQSFVGEEANAKRGILNLKYPVEQGIITNWDDMETLWQYTYKTLGVSAEEQPVLLTDVANNPVANREKMTQIMMESFNTPAVLIANQGALALYAEGRVTGVTVTSGTAISQVVPIKEGTPVSNACLGFGGRDLDFYFMKTLIENGASFNHRYCLEDVCKIKEMFGYIAVDYNQELAAEKSDLEKTYELPDEEVVTIKTERFSCPEALFQPSLLGKDIQTGIHKTCYDYIMACDEGIRKGLFGNIVLSGGSTLFPGFAERMERELRMLGAADVNIIASPNRIHNVWIGGSIVASQPTFEDLWLSKKDYEEHGTSLLHQKYI